MVEELFILFQRKGESQWEGGAEHEETLKQVTITEK